MSFEFGEVLTRAWQITWKYKVLWIFGILAGCTKGGGGGGGGGSNTGYDNGPSDLNIPPELERLSLHIKEFVNWAGYNIWLFIVIIVLFFLVVLLISVFLGTIGRIGLIRGSYQAEMGIESLSFGELFSSSMPYFWRVFGLSFLIGLAFFLILIPFILIGVLTAGMALLCFLPVFCLFIPLSFVVSIIIEQANRAIVLENLSMFDGLKRGWVLARAHAGPLLIVGLILFVITFVTGFIIAIPIFIVVFPTILAFVVGEGRTFTPLYLALACICLYIPLSWVLNGILTTFSQSVWTITYMRLTQHPEVQEKPAFVEPYA